MNLASITARINVLSKQVMALSEEIEAATHRKKWDEAIEQLFGEGEEPEDHVRIERTETGGYIFPDEEAAYVEQIEILIHDETGQYHVRFRYDDDSTEKLGIFDTYAPAYEYARQQARRYHIPIFDTTYEDLVD